MTKNKKQLNPKNGTVRINFIPQFVRNPLLQRWAIVLIMGMVLTFLLSPQIYLFTPEYKVGSIAAKDIKADRDFLVMDRSSTEQRKLEAAQSVRDIYDYDVDVPLRIGMAMAKAFIAMAETYQRIEQEKVDAGESNALLAQARQKSENIMGIALTDREFNAFDRYKFSFDICNNNVKLIYSVYNRGIISREDFSGLVTEKSITIRNIKNQQEKDESDLTSILSLQAARSLLEKNARHILKDEHKDLSSASVSLLRRVIQPNLTFAKNATERRKGGLVEAVKPVFYKVQKNEMILREGEKITAVHLDKLADLYSEQEGKKFVNISIFIGMFLAILLFSVVLYHIFKSQALSRTRSLNTDILMLGVAAILQVLLVIVSIFICESISRTFAIIPEGSCLYAIPFATATMLIVVLLNRDIGLIFSIFAAFLISFLFENQSSMFFYALLGSMVAAFQITDCKERSAFFKTGLLVGAVNIAVIISLSLLEGKLFTTVTLFNLLTGAVGGILAAAVVTSILPLFESLFGYTTDIKLLELANLNQPIFQEMIMVAPGTYHHSVVVASMVETAAEAIGSNSLLAKVSAYYHDIGKMKKSLYFIENQQGSENKLDKLSPKMSSLVIISHVKEGCELAKEYKLGKVITDIIKQHHGTRLVGYFYDKAQKDTNPSVRSIPEGDFRYPGPKPQSKEAGLVLLGDVVEASSRVLKNPTPSRIKNLVEDRINQVLTEGELNESELTFKDLSKIAESFTRTLNGIFHQRIDYPESNTKESNGKKEKDANSYRKPPEKSRTRHVKASSLH